LPWGYNYGKYNKYNQGSKSIVLVAKAASSKEEEEEEEGKKNLGHCIVLFY
jgi:hypothetical protein